jgi:hypothetical protein
MVGEENETEEGGGGAPSRGAATCCWGEKHGGGVKVNCWGAPKPQAIGGGGGGGGAPPPPPPPPPGARAEASWRWSKVLVPVTGECQSAAASIGEHVGH